MQDLVHSHRRQRLVAHKAKTGGHRRDDARQKPRSPGGPSYRGPLHTGLAVITLVWVLVYLPIEIYTSWNHGGLFRFAFWVDAVGIALLVAGVTSALRQRHAAAGLLVAGWAWTSANFWRATMERYWAVAQGATLYAGEVELWLGPGLTGLAMLLLGASLTLAIRYGRP